MVTSGECVVTIDSEEGSKEVGKIAVGGYFGEIALLRNQARNATVAAVGRRALKLQRLGHTLVLSQCVYVWRVPLAHCNGDSPPHHSTHQCHKTCMCRTRISNLT